MKSNMKKLLLVVLVLLLSGAMMLASPLSAYAKDSGVAQTQGVVLTGDQIEIEASDAGMMEQPIYSWSVYAMGTAVSSYQISFSMPAFVDVVEIVPAEDAYGSETALFTSYVDGNGVISVVYSSAVDASRGALFTVRFTVKDYAPAYAAVELIQARFVNTYAQEINVIRQNLGSVTIGTPSFAMKGDVDGNGVVNLADLLIIQRSMVNPDYTLNEQQYQYHRTLF